MVTICDHPLIQHQLSIVRDKHSNSEVFRLAIQRVAQLVLQEATRDLALTPITIETPLCQMQAQTLATHIPIIVIPILRAGLMMSDVMLNLIPNANLYYIGLYRDEETLQPITYYNKLPTTFNYQQARIFILDPMLATGGSISAALHLIKKLGAVEKNITVASIIAAPEGIQTLTDHFPEIKIFSATKDEFLNEHAYIVPGLGDAGDRAFNTI